MAVAVSLTDPYRTAFDAFARSVADTEPAWLRKLRTSAMDHLQKAGFPTTKDEDWKHTNAAPLARTPFAFDPHPAEPRIPGDLIEAYTFGVLKCSQLVFVNGRFAPKLSYLRWLPEGVRIRSLREVLHFDPKAVQGHLG